MSEIEVCSHCQHSECICRWCIVCQKRRLNETETQTCQQCVTRARTNLDLIVELYALLPAEVAARAYTTPPTFRNGPGSNELPMPGGDALAMLLGGSTGFTAPPPLDPETGEFVGDELLRRQHAEFESDPPSVAAMLASWEDDWRNSRGHEPASGPATVVACVAYLGVNLGWAANWHPAFDEFAADIRKIVNQLESVTSTTQRAERAPVPCFELINGDRCGGVLERHWTDRGLDDNWRCRECRRVYTPAGYYLAVTEALQRAQAS